MSFHMQKKLLSLQRYQIFNQDSLFFMSGVGGGAKRFRELWVPLKKSSLRPWHVEAFSYKYLLQGGGEAG